MALALLKTSVGHSGGTPEKSGDGMVLVTNRGGRRTPELEECRSADKWIVS